MKVLLAHNRYQQKGGEDVVFNNEKNLLQHNGVEIVEYIEDNKAMLSVPVHQAAIETIWSERSRKSFADLLRIENPDVVHFHNTFMRMSPSVYYACHQAGIPVVQTLHNYRVLCPNALFYRDAKICEDCIGKVFAWPGILHACYRESRSQTAATAAMLTFHNIIKTWQTQITTYIALTQFARQKFIDGGLPEEKIAVKPNFIVPDPGERNAHGEYAIFVGRIAEEKGISLLLEAWSQVEDIPLKVLGTGPLFDTDLIDLAAKISNKIELLGNQPRENVIKLLKGSSFLVISSQWYEGFPMTLVEAFACGVPVIAPKLGSMLEIVTDGQTGLHFETSDVQSLTEKILWAWNHPEKMAEMGKQARDEYEKKYTAQHNFRQLQDIYQKTIINHGK